MVAVEPLSAMLAQFSRALPAIPAVSAVAESLPFQRGCFSGLTIGVVGPVFVLSGTNANSVPLMGGAMRAAVAAMMLPPGSDVMLVSTPTS